MLRVINYQMSLHAERVAAVPTAKMMVDARVIAGNEDDWDSLNKQPKAYVKYNAADEVGNALPVPQVFPVDKDNTDLISGVQSMSQMVTAILGSPTGEPPKNETEVSVLLRKSISEATANRYIKSLGEGLEAIGEVILQWLPTLFDVERNYNNHMLMAINDISGYVVVVDAGPVISSQQSKTVAQLMAVDRLLASNPNSQIIPVIIKNLDMPMEDKQIILQQLMSANQPVVDPAMQQAMAQKDEQLQQATVDLQEKDKQISMLQQSLFEMENDSKASMWETQQKIASDERKHAMDLQWERDKFMMELQAKAGKLTFDAIEQDKDRQLEAQIEADKMRVELEKDRNDAREQAMQIEVPVFTNSKFTS